jgi:hypothetical protein
MDVLDTRESPERWRTNSQSTQGRYYFVAAVVDVVGTPATAKVQQCSQGV